MQRQFDDHTAFEVFSGNNFPKACGIASSASSFAALTLAYSKFLLEAKGLSYRLIS